MNELREEILKQSFYTFSEEEIDKIINNVEKIEPNILKYTVYVNNAYGYSDYDLFLRDKYYEIFNVITPDSIIALDDKKERNSSTISKSFIVMSELKNNLSPVVILSKHISFYTKIIESYSLHICLRLSEKKDIYNVNNARFNHLFDKELVNIIPNNLKTTILNDLKESSLLVQYKIEDVNYSDFIEKSKEFVEEDESEYHHYKDMYIVDNIYGSCIVKEKVIDLNKNNVSVIVSRDISYQNGEPGYSYYENGHIYIYNPNKMLRVE